MLNSRICKYLPLVDNAKQYSNLHQFALLLTVYEFMFFHILVNIWSVRILNFCSSDRCVWYFLVVGHRLQIRLSNFSYCLSLCSPESRACGKDFCAIALIEGVIQGSSMEGTGSEAEKEKWLMQGCVFNYSLLFSNSNDCQSQGTTF